MKGNTSISNMHLSVFEMTKPSENGLVLCRKVHTVVFFLITVIDMNLYNVSDPPYLHSFFTCRLLMITKPPSSDYWDLS